MAAIAYTREGAPRGLKKALISLSTAIAGIHRTTGRTSSERCATRKWEICPRHSDLGECIGMWPSLRGVFQSGASLDLQGTRAETPKSEHTMAITHDPNFISAYYQSRPPSDSSYPNYESALKDFDKSFQCDRKARPVAAGRHRSRGAGTAQTADQEFAIAVKHAMSAIKHGIS